MDFWILLFAVAGEFFLFLIKKMSAEKDIFLARWFLTSVTQTMIFF